MGKICTNLQKFGLKSNDQKLSATLYYCGDGQKKVILNFHSYYYLTIIALHKTIYNFRNNGFNNPMRVYNKIRETPVEIV